MQRIHFCRPVRILVVSTSLEGGAGGAATRLWQGLTRRGLDCRAVVDREPAEGDGVVRYPRSRLDRFLRGRLDRLPLRSYPDREPTLFSAPWLPSGVHRFLRTFEPDLVNLHWIVGGFVPVQSVPAIGCPLVWTLHDMWPLTGGCHFSGSCERYVERCGACPRLGSEREQDLSRRVWSRKTRAWRRMEVTIVAPSTWLADCARRSSLFRGRRVEVIPYGIDLETFRPVDRAAARELLRLSTDRQIILFGAWEDSERKGRAQLVAALERLAARGYRDRLQLVVYGFPMPDESVAGIPVRALGRIHDPWTLAAAASAADVFVLPSLADNLPLTVIEAMACGTPCVGFRTGGVPDLIEHERTGWLAEPFEPDSLAEGLAWVLDDAERAAELGRSARAKAEREYDQGLQARRYHELFLEVLEGTRGQR